MRSPLRALSTLLLALCALHCDKDQDSAATDSDADTDSDTDSDTDADSDSDSDTDPASSPVVTSADAWCYLHEVGKKAYMWMATCDYDDPQGLETVSSFEGNRLVVSTGGTEVATYDLACGAGSCSGSFKETDDGVICANASTYTLAFQVMDEDGNLSAPYEVTGRKE